MAEPAADPDRFDAAVEAFRKRVPMDREAWDLLTTQQRERAFMVSRVTEARVLQSTFDAIDRAVAEGGTFEEFKDAVAADLIEAWGGEIPGRLETIFRTNIQCVLPGQLVTGRVIAASRAFYDGEAVEIRTKSGRRLAVTPNHPVLTSRGFIAAKDLRHGDHVLCNRGRIQDGVLAGVAQEGKQNRPASIDEIFGALANACGGSVSRALGSFDLHGDAVRTQGNVDIVRTNRKLLQDLISSVAKARGDVILTNPFVSLPSEPSQRQCLAFGIRMLDTRSPSASCPSGRVLGALLRWHSRKKKLLRTGLRTALDVVPSEQVVNLFQRQARGSGQVGHRFPFVVALEKRFLHLYRDFRFQPTSFGATANRDTKGAKPAQQNRGIHSNVLGDLLGGNPGLVELDEVIEVGNRNLRSHVYDLQTDDGFYSTGQIYVSNCAYGEGRHAIMSSPTVRQARPYWRFDDAETDRECDLCSECGGTVLPADDPWWKTHSPPLHHNAVLGSSLIATSKGQVLASQLALGDMVVTHRGRLRPVTAVMRKVSQNKSVKLLQTDSGRVLVITHEHPVLVDSPANGLVWKMVGQLQVGDVLFQLDDECPRSHSTFVAHPEDAPPLGRQPRITDSIMSLSVTGPVALSIYLDGNHADGESNISDIGSDGVLSDSPKGSEQTEKVLLSWGQFLSVRQTPTLCTCDPNRLAVEGVVAPHPVCDQGKSFSPGPMVDPSSLRDHIRSLVRQGNLLLSRSNLDAELAAPVGQHALRGSRLLLQIPNALFGLPMLTLNQSCESLPGPRRFVHTRIIAVEQKVYDGQLCDFEVAEDNSYVADSILVHNCECKKTALSREEAEEEGIDDKGPKIEADEGFGDKPSHDGTNWDFDLSGMDPELRAIVESALKEAPERPDPAEKPDGAERKPEREPEPVKEQRDILDLISDDKTEDAVDVIFDEIGKMGAHTWDVDMKVQIIPKSFGDTRASHSEGLIKISKETADAARRFTEAVKSTNGDIVRIANEMIEDRSGGRPGKYLRNFSEEKEALARDSSGVQAIVHESFHGAGPRGLTDASSVEGWAIDEITTEMASRRFMFEHFGIKYPVRDDWRLSSFCGYSDLTETMRNIIKKVVKVGDEEANVMLENASLKFKSRADVLTRDSPVQSARKMFSEAFGSHADAIAREILHTTWE
jgi:hypothetical protein